ncbi:MAG TPA: hypothetical protein VJG90_08545 [Candidatus Nanoarchaeia archaeon]|nr:hypothetical protein [Candidatus Nanoarchaeia archaeon]
MSELDKIRKKLEKEFEENVEVDEDSEHPIHEKYTKLKKKKWLKE